jgi:hypothetical protein
VAIVDSRNEIREFLATRRAKLTPQQAGIPLYGGLKLTIYTAEPGSASEDQIKLLASWAATHNQARANPGPAKSAERT